MTGRERLFAALKGQPTDRRPVGPLLSLYGARLTSCPTPEYYQRAEAYAHGQAAVNGLFHPDVIFGPFATALEAAAFGAAEDFGRDRPPVISTGVIHSAAEAHRLVVPDPDSHPRLVYMRDALTGVAKACGREAIVAAPALSPLDLPALLLGLDAWLDALLFDPDAASRIVERTMAHFVRWSNTLLSAGADIVVVPIVFSNPSIVGRRVAESFGRNALREAIAAVQGPVVLHHGGARLSPYLSLFADLGPNVVGFALGEGEDMTAARAAIGTGRLLFGNIDGPRLPQRSSEEIAAACASVLQAARDDPQFVLGTSNADIPLDTPPSRVFAMIDSVRASGDEDATGPASLTASGHQDAVDLASVTASGDHDAGVPASEPATGQRKNGNASAVLVACSVFRPEIEQLSAEGALDGFDVLYVDSNLHLVPRELEAVLGSVIEAQARRSSRVALVYGDCHAHMSEHAAKAATARPACLNCCELYLGRERYRQLRREGAFIVLPEWAVRWRETLERTLGPDAGLARAIMREMHTRIVYLAQAGTEVPVQALNDMSAYTGLPWDTEQLDLSQFRHALGALVETTAR